MSDLLLRKPENIDELLAGITPEIHANLKTAIELGKWPDGGRLTREQIDLCLQAVIAWEQRNLPEAERVAWTDRERRKP